MDYEIFFMHLKSPVKE